MLNSVVFNSAKDGGESEELLFVIVMFGLKVLDQVARFVEQSSTRILSTLVQNTVGIDDILCFLISRMKEEFS